MSITRTLAACALLAAACLPARARDDDPEPPSRTKSYKTPQAVFDAQVVALQKRDYRTLIDCVAPASHKEMAGLMAYGFLMSRKQGGDEAAKLIKPLAEVMDRHGLTDKATRDIKTDDQEAAVKALSKLIKKPTAFAVDLTAALFKMMEAQPGAAAKLAEVKYKLEGLEISGDRATASAVASLDGNEFKQRVKFVKVRGGWKLLPNKNNPLLGGPAPDVPPPPVPPQNEK